MKRKILFLILIVVLAFIWIHSMMPQNVSAAESGSALDVLTPFLEIFFGKGNVTDHIVRKLAHFTEYAVLGLVLVPVFKGRKRYFVHAVEHAFFVAFIDETIQIFSGRGPAIKDVWIDVGGAFTGAVIITLILFLVSKKAGKKKN